MALRGSQSWPVGPAALIGLGFVIACPLFAQNEPPGDRANYTTATLPESNEAGLLTSQIEQAIQRGDFRLAIQLAERLTDLPEELVAVPASRTYYPVWRQSVRLLEQLPPQGIELYRELYDPEVAARYREALSRSDLEALRELFREYRLSTIWPEVGRDLTAMLLDRGESGEAVDALRALSERSDANRPQRQAQLVAALARARAWGAAAEVLGALERDETVLKLPGWPARLVELRAWLDAARTGRRAIYPDNPLIEAGTAWSQPLVPTPTPIAIPYDDDARVAAGIDAERALPLHEPVFSNDRIFVRLRGNLWCFDALTLQPLWREAELQREDNDFSDLIRDEASDAAEASPDTRLLLQNALRHALATGFGAVYSIERLKLAESGYQRFADQAANVLVARDAATGQVRWVIGDSDKHPLFGAAFQDAPIALDHALAVVIEQGNHIQLCLIAPDTGALLRRVAIAGPPTYLNVNGGRALLGADETSIFVMTGNGVIASLGRNDLRWKWAATYQSTLPDRLAGAFWGARPTPRDYPICRPVLCDDLLVLAPVDSPHILAIDRFSGRQRWQIDRGPHELLVGAVDAGLVLAGSTITCVDIADGQTVRWRSVPVELTGRPAVWGDRVYLPTRDGILALDGHNGKILSGGDLADLPATSQANRDAPFEATILEERAAGALRTANLLALPDGLVAVSPNRIAKLPAPATLGVQLRERLDLDPADPRALFAAAWNALITDRPLDALEILERIPNRNPRWHEAREAVLTNVFVALARRAGEPAERLSWLRRAAALSGSADVTGRLARLIGEALEQSGDIAAFADHYRELIERDSELPIRDGRGRATAAWLYALERLFDASERLDPDLKHRFLEQIVGNATARGDLRLLLRLHPLVNDPIIRTRIDIALSGARIAPELLVRCLPADDPTLPLTARAGRLLTRWNTHAALGELRLAENDQADWRALLALPASGPTADGAAGAEAINAEQMQLAQRIERAMQKLRDGEAPPLGESPRRQWNPVAELIEDARDPRLITQPFALTRGLDTAGTRVIQLRSTASGELLRQTEDFVIAAPENERRLAKGDLGGARAALWPLPGATWPAATFGHLAAVPARGGLVCVGLGPERSGGQRIWEAAIADWSDFPAGLAERFVAGPLGVFVAVRPDRVALIGWPDGRVWWQLDLDGMTAQRLELAGNRLIIIGPDQQAVSVSAAFGNDLQRLGLSGGAPRATAVAADRLLVWTERAILALDPRTFEVLWSLPGREFGAWRQVDGAPYALIRSPGTAGWQMIDLETGAVLFPGRFEKMSEIFMAAADPQTLYIASLSTDTTRGVSELGPGVTFSAFRRANGEPLWSVDRHGLPPAHPSQLNGNERYIPVLDLAAPTQDGERTKLSDLVMQLIRKSDGTVTAPIAIGARFEGIDLTQSGIYTIVTPTRVLIQVGGRIVAFGESTAESTP